MSYQTDSSRVGFIIESSTADSVSIEDVALKAMHECDVTPDILPRTPILLNLGRRSDNNF